MKCKNSSEIKRRRKVKKRLRFRLEILIVEKFLVITALPKSLKAS